MANLWDYSVRWRHGVEAGDQFSQSTIELDISDHGLGQGDWTIPIVVCYLKKIHCEITGTIYENLSMSNLNNCSLSRTWLSDDIAHSAGRWVVKRFGFRGFWSHDKVTIIIKASARHWEALSMFPQEANITFLVGVYRFSQFEQNALPEGWRVTQTICPCTAENVTFYVHDGKN